MTSKTREAIRAHDEQLDATAAGHGAPLRWFSRIGMALLSAAAHWPRGAGGPVLMMGPTDEGMACCHLALPNTECNYSGGNKANFTCPSGFHRQWWFCCEGTRQAGCGECTTDISTCWSGSFKCSIWWWTGQPC